MLIFEGNPVIISATVLSSIPSREIRAIECYKLFFLKKKCIEITENPIEMFQFFSRKFLENYFQTFQFYLTALAANSLHFL